MNRSGEGAVCGGLIAEKPLQIRWYSDTKAETGPTLERDSHCSTPDSVQQIV